MSALTGRTLVFEMLERLDARSGSITLRFPYFVSKAAPVSGVNSLLDHDVEWCGSVDADGQFALRVRVVVPATSLCPCSKQISDYGAHNQRSPSTLQPRSAIPLSIEELIAIAEASASCEVYGLLKRADESSSPSAPPTTRKFVEDLVRDVAHALDQDARIGGYLIEQKT
ncbi:MAG: GTP cyclohydrolase I FolE2 [Xanthomonadales bacterium]|nr:GTP cyclohydrolase I FolE2 [Xanthomonadales bacterium]